MIDWPRRRRKRDDYSEELERLRARAHDGLGTYDFEGQEVPLITFPRDRFEEMLERYLATDPGSAVSANLNILRDYTGNVFVDVVLTFRNGEREVVTIDASRYLFFFERLAETTMLAVGGPPDVEAGRIFVVQLPRMQKAEHALDIIKDGLAYGK